MGAKIISKSCNNIADEMLLTSNDISVFSLVSCVAIVHGVRDVMRSLRTTGTDFSTAKGMDPKSFFGIMGTFSMMNLN